MAGLASNLRIEVEFLPWRPSYVNSGEEEDEEFKRSCSGNEVEPPELEHGGKYLSVEPYPRDPGMGASVGLIGEHGGDTLGGFAHLTIGDQVYRGWLTNHHIIHSNA